MIGAVGRPSAILAVEPPSQRRAALRGGCSPGHDRTEMTDSADTYAWADEWESLGFCLAVVDLPDPVEVLSRLIRRPATAGMTPSEATAWIEHESRYGTAPYVTVAGAAQLGSWTVVVEGIGFEATTPGTPERLTAGGYQAAVIYRSVNADMQVIWARDGQIVRSFDPLLYEIPGVGDVLPEEEGLRFGLGSPTGSSFALLERLTGLSLTQELLDDRSDRWLCVGLRPGP